MFIPLFVTRDPDRRAACVGSTAHHPRPAEVEAAEFAQDMCRACPIVAECRRYAIEAPEPFGIWGGLTEAERWPLIDAHREALGLPEWSPDEEDPAVVAALAVVAVEPEPDDRDDWWGDWEKAAA